MIRKYVYLMESVDPNGLEYYKIGISNKPEKRCKELQTGNPNKISVLKTYSTTNFLKVESMLHKKYWCSRTEAMNEWRTLDIDNVINFIGDCEKSDDLVKFLLKNNSLYE